MLYDQSFSKFRICNTVGYDIRRMLLLHPRIKIPIDSFTNVNQRQILTGILHET